MLFAVSREHLCEIFISGKFPTLEAFADVIYEEPGETFVRLKNGEQTIITVQKFHQGCPVSPVFAFAAIILNEILSTIQKNSMTEPQ
jgi:hypothetical protein